MALGPHLPTLPVSLCEVADLPSLAAEADPHLWSIQVPGLVPTWLSPEPRQPSPHLLARGSDHGLVCLPA